MGDALGSSISGPAQERFPRKLRMGMVGGGRDAFIGAVHRRAAMLDGGVELVAGAFSSTPEKSLASGWTCTCPRIASMAPGRRWPRPRAGCPRIRDSISSRS
jgi:hypothetical protein